MADEASARTGSAAAEEAPADGLRRSGDLAPASSGRDANVAAKEDPAKTPPHPGGLSRASREDVEKAAAAENAAAAEAQDKSTGSAAEGSPGPEGDTTGANSPLVSDEERAARDKRLQLAEDGSRIEQRPETHPGLKSAQPDHTDYTVERELREQWPLSYDESA